MKIVIWTVKNFQVPSFFLQKLFDYKIRGSNAKLLACLSRQNVQDETLTSIAVKNKYEEHLLEFPLTKDKRSNADVTRFKNNHSKILAKVSQQYTFPAMRILSQFRS